MSELTHTHTHACVCAYVHLGLDFCDCCCFKKKTKNTYIPRKLNQMCLHCCSPLETTTMIAFVLVVVFKKIDLV